MPITPDAISFLAENRFQNDKEWYDAHKDLYKQSVLEPLFELVRELAPCMHEIDPRLICDPRVGGSVSRVRRDTRFSKDKSLYRDVAWVVFMRDKKLYNGLPAYFFEFSPRSVRYGLGYYQADRSSLDCIRSLILENDPAFLAAAEAYEAQSVFSMEGELYKRSRFPNADERAGNWLNRKNIDFIRHESDFSLLFSDALAETLSAHFRLLAPIYSFLMKAEDIKSAMQC